MYPFEQKSKLKPETNSHFNETNKLGRILRTKFPQKVEPSPIRSFHSQTEQLPKLHNFTRDSIEIFQRRRNFRDELPNQLQRKRKTDGNIAHLSLR